MRAIQAVLGLVGLAGLILNPFPSAAAGGTAPERASQPELRVAVDPRVELLSLLFRLAGNPEYNQGRVAPYTTDVEKQFRPFAEHAAVKLARELRQRQGVSYDACMAMAVHLSDANKPELRIPLKPWPEGLDRRWTPGSAERFASAARDFVKETSFQQFLTAHRSLYTTTEQRLRALMQKEGHLEWFSQFFGERPQAQFTLVPGLLNGGCCYGARFLNRNGPEELFAILGVWQTDAAGMPEFTAAMLGTVVHEFCHSYANLLVDRHASELREPGDKLYRTVSDQMQSQAYGNGETMLREYLVRACVIRYLREYQGADAAARAVEREKANGFAWIKGLVDLLGEYEAQRNQQQTLEKFAPRLVAFFKDTAERAAREHADLEPRRPKVVSVTPKNGDTAVDPGLSAIEVVFDRPMRNGSWSLVGGGPHFPELVGKPSYDSTGTKWKVGIKLKPAWDYEFMINSAKYDAFRSRDGVPVTPLRVTFTTAGQKISE